MRIGICDDEKAIRNMLAEKVKKDCPEAELVLYSSGEALLGAEEELDLLFLDIQMPGRDGMETAREFRKRNHRAILIFVTVTEEYVFQAFDVGAFHYLVKPFSDEKFGAVFCKALEQYRERTVCLPEKEERYLMIKKGGNSSKVLLRDIIYAEVFNRKIILHGIKEDMEYYGRMSMLQKEAGEDFFRSHRAYLVHFKYVEKYNASTIYLERGTALMAKQKYPEFVKQFLKYNQRKGSRYDGWNGKY